MRATTFFIDAFKEISLTTPSGLQEDGGVYGDNRLSYSAWTLGSPTEGGDTADFVGITKTNILYGELYKVTLDTGNMFNPQVPGGPPNLFGQGGFVNMELQDYWEHIFDGRFKLNNTTYDEYMQRFMNLSVSTRQRGTPPQINYPTLLQFARGVKERVGWVEINRTVASIYYEAGSTTGGSTINGKRAVSDHFYDIDEFIMTPELFNPDDSKNPSLINFFKYSNPNPYVINPQPGAQFIGTDDKFRTQSPLLMNPTVSVGAYSGISLDSRIGLRSIDSWYTWENTNAGHNKRLKDPADGINFGFDILPWPKRVDPTVSAVQGNNMTVLQNPNEYLKFLLSDNFLTLESDIDNGPRTVKVTPPSGLGTIIKDLPIVIASRQNNFNTLMSQRLATKTALETLIPISPQYSTDIWGDIRITIPRAIKSQINSPSNGTVQPVDGLEGIKKPKEEDDLNNLGINDPFGLELYELDKEYQEIYTKFKFCPPRKKVKYDFNIDKTKISNQNSGQSVKVTTGNTEEYNIDSFTNVIKIGSFNPDAELFFDKGDGSLYKRPNIDINNPSPRKSNQLFDISYEDINTSIETFTETEETDNFDGIYDTFSWSVGRPLSMSFFDAPNDSVIKNNLRNFIASSNYNELEILYGIRSKNDFLITDTNIPYGTYSHTIEKKELPNEATETTIKIKQNGADADPTEFKKSVESIVKISSKNKSIKPIGVLPNGFPIYPKNTLEQSILDLKEQLTGVKEIVFRGSDVLYGAVSQPQVFNYSDVPKVVNFFEGPRNFEYINTGISISGTVDLSTGEKYGVHNVYSHKIFRNDGTIKNEILMKDKESNVQKGSIDFVGTYKKWQPYGDPDAGNTNSKRPIHEVTHLLVSKYDIFGNERIIWASTPENPNGSPILSTTTGTLFLESRVQPIQKSSLGTSNFVIDTYIFNINGKPIDAGSYYKIPVSFVRSKYNIEPGYSELSMWNDIGRNEKLSYITFFTSYSKEVTTKKPSTQSTVTSGKNTYGGWVFNGLWHRDGSWPIDHKFRSGLLNLNVNNPGASAAWQACDGAVNTGAWIRVNDERVVVESHDFISNSRDTIYRYFHDIHTNIRGQLDIENNTTTALSIDLPVIKFEPDENRELENWEKALVTQRRMALDSIRSIQDKVVIIRLRSNKEDVERGFNEINLFEGQTIDRNDDATRGISRKPGHLLETWILFGVPSANMDEWTDFLLDDNQSGFYSMRWYAEPTDHTRGEFKKDEWYKAVFTRVVTSPSNPNGQMGGIERYTDPLLDRTTGKITNSCREQFLNPKRGIHKVNENNKKTFCDLLYVSEQILKMHRARLVEIKKYVDAKKNYVEQSGSELGNKSFKRSMIYVNTLRQISKFFKKNWN